MILITGGARSDKVLYIATSVVTDDEMAGRVNLHRQARPAHWRTWEGNLQLGRVIDEQAAAGEAVILECITTWIANLMFDHAGETPVDDIDFDQVEALMQQQVTELLAACTRSPAMVSVFTGSDPQDVVGILPNQRHSTTQRQFYQPINHAGRQ